MKRRRSHAWTRKAGPTRGIATFVALLALFLQGFLVQTHVHFFSPTVAAYEQSAGTAAHSDAAHVDAANHQAACAICQAFANAGRTTLPAAPALISISRIGYETAALEIRVAPRALTHSWQSRAPPIAL